MPIDQRTEIVEKRREKVARRSARKRGGRARRRERRMAKKDVGAELESRGTFDPDRGDAFAF